MIPNKIEGDIMETKFNVGIDRGFNNEPVITITSNDWFKDKNKHIQYSIEYLPETGEMEVNYRLIYIQYFVVDTYKELTKEQLTNIWRDLVNNSQASCIINKDKFKEEFNYRAKRHI